MAKVWILTGEYSDGTPEILGIYAERADGFRAYAERVTARFSTSAATIIPNDYNPTGDVSYENRHGNGVSLTGYDLVAKGGK